MMTETMLCGRRSGLRKLNIALHDCKAGGATRPYRRNWLRHNKKQPLCDTRNLH
jgi:hypothetical protein